MSEQTIKGIVNGVNVDKIFQTVDAIKGQADIAKFNFRATNQWIKGGYNKTTVDKFYGACQTHSRAKPFEFIKDEPPVLLGEDNGANPVEFALAALAGCLTTSLVYHAAAKGIKVDEVESTLEGNLDHGFLGLDPKIRNGYESINVKFKIKSRCPKRNTTGISRVGKK
jgi:uncharacterized OsmC-like protein